MIDWKTSTTLFLFYLFPAQQSTGAMTNHIIESKPTKDQECKGFVPVKLFVEKTRQTEEDNPYSSTFSFLPFIEKMKEKKMSVQKTVKEIDSGFMEKAMDNLLAYSDPKRLDTREKRQEVIGMLFPSLFFEGQLGFVAKPFTKEFFYTTPAFQEILTSDDWEVQLAGHLTEGKIGSPAIEAGKLILKNCHGVDFESTTYQTMTFRNKKTKLLRYLKVNVVLDFIKTTPLKPIKKLNDQQIHQLLNEWDNEAYWLEHFPPEDFVFEGLFIGNIQDVTEEEVLSEIKEMMITNGDVEVEKSGLMREHLKGLIASYLQMPNLDFGNLLNRDFKYAKLFSWSIMGDLEILAGFTKDDFQQSPTYGQAMTTRQPILIGDLKKVKQAGKVEARLLENGYRSILLCPQKDSQGRMIGIMELASSQPYRFNRHVLDKLSDIISLFSVGSNRWIKSLDDNVSFFIQKQFTYIHPSVEWKFQEVSQKFLMTPREADTIPTMEPIAFKNVYPLYGQADIVGSSKIRNYSIEADMLDNLHRVQNVMKAIRKSLPFQLLDIFLSKTASFIHRLENGAYVSSDESQIVELLVEEIHPLLREMNKKYDQIPKEALEDYFSYLDPKLDIVYRQRRDYEDSVQALNDLIAHYVDEEVAKKQEVLPHFFEKYVTDGVEYNIYLGQSILEEGQFSYYFLQDFRLWQLILMCEVTRLVEAHKSKFPVPLTTAQLIFVYNNALSIRFNMDEKQFDVDGAYNVRYEILKKRIDKAVIKGTKERLTQEGKIAIVWLQEKDRIEYLEYLEHLQQKGFITDNIEELELERLQGADGLKALRVTVV